MGSRILLISTLLAALASLSSSAEVIDLTACQQACDEQQSACIEARGEEDNPIECEMRCEDQAEDCQPRCS
jgi:hypothetical protein